MKLTVCRTLFCAIGISGLLFAQTSELATVTTLAATSDAAYGNGVRLTATVLDSNSAAVASGTVVFVDNALGPLTCTGVADNAVNGVGQATCTVINAAKYSVCAVFQDNGADRTSTSNIVARAISPATLTITPAGGATKPYGQTLDLSSYEAWPAKLVGLQYTDAGRVSYSSVGAAAAATVGKYDIVATAFTFVGGGAANYSVVLNTATGGLSVTPVIAGGSKVKAHGTRAVLWTILRIAVLL